MRGIHEEVGRPGKCGAREASRSEFSEGRNWLYGTHCGSVKGRPERAYWIWQCGGLGDGGKSRLSGVVEEEARPE